MKKILIAAGFIVTLTLTSLTTVAQTQSREDILKAIAAKRAELSELEALILAPSDEDQAKYTDFLKSPDTGLFRLLSRDDVNGKSALTIRGGGAYYSFKERTNEYVNSSALGL